IDILRIFLSRPTLAKGPVRVRNDLEFVDQMNDAFLRYIDPRRVGQVHPEFFEIDLEIFFDEGLTDGIKILTLLEQGIEIVLDVGLEKLLREDRLVLR